MPVAVLEEHAFKVVVVKQYVIVEKGPHIIALRKTAGEAAGNGLETAAAAKNCFCFVIENDIAKEFFVDAPLPHFLEHVDTYSHPVEYAVVLLDQEPDLGCEPCRMKSERSVVHFI